MSPEFWRGTIAGLIICGLFYAVIAAWYWLL